jgi:RNA polymerase sigma-70 factor, ECF subfamily
MSETMLDIELVEGFKKGDAACFTELLERYTQKVHNLAVRITRNEEDAEEVLQDVFVTVHNKVDKFEGKSAFSSWLYRITVNTAFMKLRKRRQTPAISLEEVSPSIKESWVGRGSDSSDVNYLSARHELRSELDKAISHLPEEYKMIFILRDVDGLSNQEVGEILKLSVPAVKSRLHRSRLMLRKKLQKYYQDYLSEEVISYGPRKEEITQWAA